MAMTIHVDVVSAEAVHLLRPGGIRGGAGGDGRGRHLPAPRAVDHAASSRVRCASRSRIRLRKKSDFRFRRHSRSAARCGDGAGRYRHPRPRPGRSQGAGSQAGCRRSDEGQIFRSGLCACPSRIGRSRRPVADDSEASQESPLNSISCNNLKAAAGCLFCFILTQ